MGKFFKCCQECDHRSVGCHSTCQDYLTEKEIWKSIQSKVKLKAETNWDIESYMVNVCDKINKRRNQM